MVEQAMKHYLGRYLWEERYFVVKWKTSNTLVLNEVQLRFPVDEVNTAG